jgi:flagellar motor switch/type III secretory pathway protein FliN
MNARAFDLGTCPRVRARQARATRAVLRACASLPERWSVDLPPLGSATMTFAGYDSDPDRIDAAELAVSFGAGRGRVSVESSFAARLVDTVLGGGAVFSTARAIGPAGRGVLVGVLAPVFDRIGGSLQLGRSVLREGGRDRDLASVLFRLETVVASGWLRLTPPAGDLLPRIDGSDAWRTRAGRLPVTGSVEIAATGVPAGALAGMAVGDAVVFDGVRAATFAASGSWDCRLRVGGHAADVTVDAAGKISIDGGFSPLQDEEGKMSASDSNTDATTVLAAASIEVVAELGRVSLRGDELLGLAPGAVLAMGMGRTGISLRVSGEVWAEGEIVDIDGELGVRVTRLANR